ncbi:MAG: MmgE/PrpD family protein [Candidatus Dormibacter sp.]
MTVVRPTLSEMLAEFAADLDPHALPDDVVSSVKDRILDTLCICHAGRGMDAGAAVRQLVADWGGTPQSSVVHDLARLPAASAALVNGTYAHSLDFDDTHLPSVVHPSATLVPAVLAQAQALACGGLETIAALAVGYEVCIRLSMAQYDPVLRNSIFFEHGFHATSIVGTVAAAVGCARLRGLDRGGIANALGVACSMGAGIIEANRMGGTVKRVHCGWAAHSAVAAAALAAAGLSAPSTVLEGDFGFFAAFCRDQWHPEAVVAGLGTSWETPQIFFKPYPCNHFTHTLVDAAMALRSRGLRGEDVAAVTIGTARASLRTIGQPIDQKRRPVSGYHAQFSAPFVFATALVGGGGLGVTLDDFSDSALADPLRRAVAERCDVVADDQCDSIFPHQFPVVVTVRTRDGRELRKAVLDNRGGPQRPLSREELLVKARCNAGPEADRLAEVLVGLDAASSIDALFNSSTVSEPSAQR